MVKLLNNYSEREERLVVAWVLITSACWLFLQWSIAQVVARPPMIIDLLFPSMLAIAGVYILKFKIPKTTSSL